MKGSSLASRLDSLICPLCEVDQLQPSENGSARCPSCATLVSGAMLETLRHISALPDALGRHACEECGHPQMRLLPDDVFHCPACGSEVLPLGTPPVDWKADERSDAYWAGWLDGRFGGSGSFADNLNLARWEDPYDRLAYYRGHRAGSEARLAAKNEPLPKAHRAPPE
jgi:ribosomal protein L37AE/L43A